MQKGMLPDRVSTIAQNGQIKYRLENGPSDFQILTLADDGIIPTTTTKH